MKKLVILTRKGCPYCEELEENIISVICEEPRLAAVEIEIKDENEVKGSDYDHYYAPAFFLDKCRISEGDSGIEAVKNALFAALEDGQ